MEKTVNFKVGLEKDGQHHQMEMAVEKFHDLYNYNQDFEPWNITSEPTPGQEPWQALDENTAQRNAISEKIETDIINTAKEKYGDDLEGLKVSIQPDYNNEKAENMIKSEYVFLAKEFDPDGHEELFKAEAQTAIDSYKLENNQYFPGQEKTVNQSDNKFINHLMDERVNNNHGTYSLMVGVEYNLNQTFRVNDHNNEIKQSLLQELQAGKDPFHKRGLCR